MYLQRASAGSGKTYALTKRYLKLFLGIKIETENPSSHPTAKREASYRLRTKDEIVGSHSHILAITFTNKATNEMKQRFIESLGALAYCTDPDKTDYMRDFTEEFDTSVERVMEAARYGLEELLNNYTEFQVSTIDSFFQGILRSFAYETDLRDNYAVELNDSYISDMGTGATFDDIRDQKASSELQYWIKKIMANGLTGGKRWNILIRKGPAYQNLKTFLELTLREDFMHNREELDKYFHTHPNMREEIESIENNIDEAMESKIKVFVDKAVQCDKEVKTLESGYIKKTFTQQLDKIINTTIDKKNLITFNSFYCTDDDLCKKHHVDKAKGLANKAGLQNAPGDIAKIQSMADDMYYALSKLYIMRKEADNIMANMSFMGLLKEIMIRISQFRQENNIVQLSDTNSILHEIINDDDTPFIYEKIGFEVHHYLIDEFQDTSSMQWINMEPLLNESVAHDYENLIIGDAKQSIYRFRNADFSIITTKVPDSRFKHNIITLGDTPEDNANWRSSHTVVEFNNAIFPFVADRLFDDKEIAFDKPVVDIKKLYLNSAQLSKKPDRDGYVEIRQKIKQEKTKSPENEDGQQGGKLPPMKEVIPIIQELRSRGYKLSDIAVLVRTNDQGTAVIDGLMQYNNEQTDPAEQINFCSTDSLSVNRSKAVSIIVALLEASLQRRMETEPEYTKSEVFINAIQSYLGKHPDDDTQKAIYEYFKGNAEEPSIDDLFKSMENIILPAQVESIIGSEFISKNLRDSEAPFIAAFQDKMLEYCETYNGDTAGFLDWWHKNSKKFTVPTPEGTEAVNIMTFHKSKGLEFRCVIIPYMDGKFEDIRESAWLSPLHDFEKPAADVEEERLREGSLYYALRKKLPPWIPMQITNSLDDTPYRRLYRKIRSRSIIDTLNNMYVAFTRPIDELYIFTNYREEEASIEDEMESLEGAETEITLSEDALVNFIAKSKMFTATPLLEDADPLLMRFTYGTLPTQEEVLRRNAKDEEKKQKTHNIPSHTLSEYYVTKELMELRYRDTEGFDYIHDLHDDANDVRHRGTVLHNVMRYLTHLSTLEKDLDFALLRAHSRGLISRKVMAEAKEFLLPRFKDARVREWFRDGVEVLNERAILTPQKANYPDRIVVDPATNTAVVIDYKFGDKKENKYISQVNRYVQLLHNLHKYARVEGWLWYVELNDFVPCKRLE